MSKVREDTVHSVGGCSEADLPLEAQSHGGARLSELRALGLGLDDVIDFSASVNPFGPSPLVRRALRRVRLERYPDPDCTELIEALSAHHGRPASMLLAGNGATELIHATVRAWGSEQAPVAIVPPTFGEYAAAARTVNVPIVSLSPLFLAGEEIERIQPSLLFLCNPNNPTGELYPGASVEQVCERMSPRPVVLDEAYMRFVQERWDALDLLDRHPNLIILRSMTKDYGLTTLRLGYAVGQPERIDRLRATLPPWTVNGLAQAAGVAALLDQGYVDVTLDRVMRAKDGLVRGLRRLGFEVTPGVANFLLVRVPDPASTRIALARQGLLVRDCRSFGLPDHLRIAVRRPREHRRLLQALAGLRGGMNLGSRNEVQ